MRFEPDMARTEGGEALPLAGAVAHSEAEQQSYAARGSDGVEGSAPEIAPQWHALWTHSHSERLVYDQLTAKGFEVFLPTIDIWSRRAGVRHRIQVPMFPGYLFIHHTMNKTGYIEVRKTRGLVGVLGERWDCLAAVPDQEIDAIQSVLRAHAPVLPHVYLREGQRVRITRGPLADVEGILVRQNPNRGLLVLSVDLLQRSVAIEVDCTWVVAA